MATMRTAKTTQERNRLRLIAAVLLAVALAITPLMHYTPTALGSEDAVQEEVTTQGIASPGMDPAGTAEGTGADDGTASPAGSEGLPGGAGTGMQAGPGVVLPEQSYASPTPLAGDQGGTGMMLLAAAPQNLFTVDAHGLITGFAYNSGDPIKDLEIPGTVGGKTVTGIGNKVFEGCALETVIIPETVQTIGNGAFRNNPQMKTVTFAGNSQLQMIDAYGFAGCSSLNGIILPASLTTLGTAAFNDCTSLTAIDIPGGITTISGSAFYGCGKLASVTLHEGLTTIGSYAFYYCTSLTALTLPDSLTTIGAAGLYACPITALTIPAHVSSIGDSALYRSAAIYLPNHYPDGIPGKPWGSGTQYIYWKTDSNTCFDVKADGAGGVIITGIKPPLHDELLGGCQNPDWHQTNRGTILIPKEIDGLSVTGLLKSAFYGNTNIKTVAFESGSAITAIPEKAFYGCTNLVSITLPDTLKGIDMQAFHGCTRLTAITVPGSVESIAAQAFAGSALQSATIEGSGALAIAGDAFPSQEFMKKIDILGRPYDSVAGQPWSAQYAEVNWMNSTYPPQVIVDEKGWHYNRITDNLVKYTGPTGPSVDVVVPKKISYQGTEYDIQNPLSGSYLINKTFRTITVAEGYEALAHRLCFQATADEVILPSTLKVVSDEAFYLASIKKVTLPEGITAIGNNTFSGCTQLTDIGNFFPSTLERIGGGAFKDVPLCIDLDDPAETRTLFPASLTSIGGDAFNNCQISGQLVIPSTVTSIGAGAFSNNPEITSIYVDEYRNDSKIKGTQPWMADRIPSVLYKGETPECSHVATPVSNLPFSIVDFTACLGQDKSSKYVTSVAGIWMAEGALTALPASGATKVFDDAVDGLNKGTVTASSLVLPNGTYTFFVATPLMTKNQVPDPTQYVPYTITVNSDAALPLSASDYTVTQSELAGLTQTSALSKANASSHDPYSGNESSYSMSSADLAAIKAMSTVGERVEVEIQAAYTGVFTYKGADYPYSLATSTHVTVTLAADPIFSYQLSFDSQGAAERASIDSLVLNVAVGTRINTAAGFPDNPTKPGYAFRGWQLPVGGWLTDADTMPAQNVLLTAVWERGTVVVVGDITIVASDFTMSMEEAITHQAKTPAEQFSEIVQRGFAKAWWTDSKQEVPIEALDIIPSSGNGKSIDAAAGDYRVTYYASDKGRQAQTTVNCTVYGGPTTGSGIAGTNFTYRIAAGPLTEDQVRMLGSVSVYDQFGSKTSEPARIFPEDLEALNAMINAGQVGDIKVRFMNAAGDVCTILVTLTADYVPPVTPASPPGGAVYAIVYPVAQALQTIAGAITGTIDDDATPLAEGHGWCWVHFYIIFLGLATVVYTLAVVARRRRFTKGLEQFEQEVQHGQHDGSGLSGTRDGYSPTKQGV